MAGIITVYAKKEVLIFRSLVSGDPWKHGAGGVSEGWDQAHLEQHWKNYLLDEEIAREYLI